MVYSILFLFLLQLSFSSLPTSFTSSARRPIHSPLSSPPLPSPDFMISYSMIGELPGHAGLWESAQETAHDLYVCKYCEGWVQKLSIYYRRDLQLSTWYMVSDDTISRMSSQTYHYSEARGLDVTPKTIEKFRSGGDEQTAHLLEDILKV